MAGPARTVAGLVGLAVGLVLLAGCSSVPNVDKAEERLCNELAELDGAVTQTAALPPNTPAARVQELKNRADKEYEQVQKAAEKVRTVRIDAVTNAINSLNRAASTATSQGVGAAADQLNQAAAELNQARVQINNAAGC